MVFSLNKQYTLILLLLVASAGCGEDTQAPLLEADEQHIVGGAPFADLLAVGALTLYGQPHCTGTLIAPRKVLTAAHCLSGVSASGLRFVLGETVANPQAVLQVARVEAHPSYSSATIANDIGLAHLAQDAPAAPLAPLQLAMDASWIGTRLLFVGYGVTSGSYPAGAGAKRAVWIGVSQVGSAAFAYSEVGRNTCSGDSGGPAFYLSPDGQYQVAGVTSYGDPTCTRYGVDTRVDRYLDFIGALTSPAPAAADPCQGETYQGRCDGAAVIWCEDETMHRLDCRAQYGRSCGWNSYQGYFGCI